MPASHNALLVILFVLSGCQSVERPDPVESKQALSELASSLEETYNSLPTPPVELPQNVLQELMASNLFKDFKSLIQSEKHFDVSANDVDAPVFFGSLLQGMPLNVVVHPGVEGKITLSLESVNLAEVLQVVEDMYGFDISLENNILQIFPAGMRTETFPLNYLYMQRQGLSMTSVSAGHLSDNNARSGGNNSNNNNGSFTDNDGNGVNANQETNGTFIRSETSTDFWGELQQTLESIIGDVGDGRQVVVSPQAGLVTVRAFPNELRQIRKFLKTAEMHLQRQVILEAKVLEVTLSDGYQQGIQWDNLLGHIGSTNFEFGTSTGGFGDQISRGLGGLTSLTINGKDFSTMINLLDTQGDVDVLSSPRVTASNNQKAVIKVGKDEYFVTNVSSTTVASNTPVTTPDVELTPFFSGIALDVTPQIDKAGGVLLHIHPSVIEVTEQIKEIKVSNSSLELPLAQSEIRESDTVIKANSGDVVVIGGLMKTESMEQTSQIPILGDIPLLGEVFKNRSKYNQKTELVILLKPTVVGGNTWRKELERTRKLLERWYPQAEKQALDDVERR